MNTTAKPIRNMINPDVKFLSTAKANIAKDKQNKKMHHNKDVRSTVENDNVTYIKPWDFVKLANIRNMTNPETVSLQSAKANISKEKVDLENKISVALRKGNVAQAEYYLHDNITGKHPIVAKAENDHLMKKLFPVKDPNPNDKPIIGTPNVNQIPIAPPLEPHVSYAPVFTPYRIGKIVPKSKPRSKVELANRLFNIKTSPSYSPSTSSTPSKPARTVIQRFKAPRKSASSPSSPPPLLSPTEVITPSSFPVISSSSKDEKKGNMQTTIERMLNALQDPNNTPMTSKKIVNSNEFKNRAKEIYNTTGVKTTNKTNVEKLTDALVIAKQRGLGLKRTEYISLGNNYQLNKNKLNKNVISISYKKNGCKLNDFKDVKVTNNLKDAILQLANGVNIEHSKLTKPELQYIDHIVKRGKINVVSSTKRNYKSIKERLAIITGEMDSGNDSILLKNELSQLLNILLDKKMINQQQAKDATKKYILKKK